MPLQPLLRPRVVFSCLSMCSFFLLFFCRRFAVELFTVFVSSPGFAFCCFQTAANRFLTVSHLCVSALLACSTCFTPSLLFDPPRTPSFAYFYFHPLVSLAVCFVLLSSLSSLSPFHSPLHSSRSVRRPGCCVHASAQRGAARQSGGEG